MKPIKPLEAEALEAEELETEVLQKHLDQLEQVTARFLTRLVLCYQNYIYNMYEVLSVPFIYSTGNVLLVTTIKSN